MSYDHSAQPLVLVVFGITGDLAQRKLLPALYHLSQGGDLPDKLKIIGISRRDVEKAEVYKQLESFVDDSSFDSTIQSKLEDATEMRQMDLLDETAYVELLSRLQDLEADMPDGTSRLYYLSIPSQAFTPIIRLLGKTGHNAPLSNSPDAPRLLIEKPFGHDLTSARELVEVVDEHFGEGQIYRIDHYVAKETVQNILTFRLQNPLFESVWNNRHIDHISVKAFEKIGIEGRADFYEQTGALRDLIQSHLLQLLAIVTMERPQRLESDDIHASKLELLRHVVAIQPDHVAIQALRGQYDGYRDETKNPDSTVETYARLELAINAERWQGVPVVLETGKAMTEKLTEISIRFKQNDRTKHDRNKLVFRIQPREGITLKLQVKRPGIQQVTDAADMDLDYAKAFDERAAEAYERVIVDAIRGDQTLFASSAEVIRSWEIVQNVLEQWSHSDAGLRFYPQGSEGPHAHKSD